MYYPTKKIFYTKLVSKYAQGFLRIIASLILASLALQPLAAGADNASTTPDTTTITDANNQQNPVQQQVYGGSPDASTTPVTQTIFIVTTSTPEQLPMSDNSVSTTTPDSISSSTPDSNLSPLPGVPASDNAILPCLNQNDASTTELNLNSTTTPDSNSTTTPDQPPANQPVSGSNQPCSQSGSGLISPLDPSSSSSTLESTTTLEMLNSNNLNATTSASTTANSGLNNIQTQNGDINNASTTTGDVNVYANVLTVANINLVNSQIVEMNDNFNKLAADLYLNQPELSAGQRTQDLVSPICSSGGVSCQSITTFKLTNQNSANIDNNVNVAGNSGGNQIAAGGDINHSSISTGDVNAVVNVLNIVNTNAINSTWTIVTFNVFGDWNGNLVMPSELYFTDPMSVGGDANSAISQVQKVILDVNNNNSSDITNNVTVQTDTGNNTVEAIPNAQGASGDVNHAAVTTGTSTADTLVRNVSNLTLYNSSWFLGLINVMGQWSGQVYSLPSTVEASYQPNGFAFVSDSDPTSAIPPELLAQLSSPEATTTIAQDNSSSQPTGTSTSDTTDSVQMDNNNQATINNNISVAAMTGQNDIAAGGDSNHTSITTGNATALANLLNFANANLINSNLYVGLVNIFGSWQGNIMFGYPNLSVSQTSPQSQASGAANSALAVKLALANQGDASIDGSQLEWKYDPSLFTITSVQSSFTYQQTTPGDLMFDLGKLPPQVSSNIAIQLQSLTNQAPGNQDKFFAHIFGNGPESNLDDNQSVLTLLADNSAPPVHGGGSGSSSSGGGGSFGGGGSSGGSSLNFASTGGGSGNGPIGVYPDVLSIYKTNSATGQLSPGNTVNFTITLDNDGNNTLNNVVIYDSLSAPDGSVINSQTYDAGTMVSRQEFKAQYSLDIAATAVSGTYTNSAYAVGLNGNLQSVRSKSSALSSFTVAGGNGSLLPNDDPSNATTTTSTLASLKNPKLLSGSAASFGLKMDYSGLVLGAACVQPAFAANLQQGSSGKDVKALQVFLNSNGFILAKRGAGSPGHETSVFGPLLKAALAKFQKANGISELGVFKAVTRNAINNLVNISGETYCPPPATPAKIVQPKKRTVIFQSPKISSKKISAHSPAVKPLAENLGIEEASAHNAPAGNPVNQSPTSGFWGSLFKHLW